MQVLIALIAASRLVLGEESAAERIDMSRTKIDALLLLIGSRYILALN
jgi:hypothetical protein